MKITTRLDHTSHCKTASGPHWSNRWTYRVFVINIRRDWIRVGSSRAPPPLRVCRGLREKQIHAETRGWLHTSLTESLDKVVLQKPIPAQTQLALYVSRNEGYVDGFILESTVAKRRYQHFP